MLAEIGVDMSMIGSARVLSMIAIHHTKSVSFEHSAGEAYMCKRRCKRASLQRSHGDPRSRTREISQTLYNAFFSPLLVADRGRDNDDTIMFSHVRTRVFSRSTVSGV